MTTTTNPFAHITGASAGIASGFLIVFFVVMLVELAAMWQVFAKAGEPGWAAIIPFYNAYVLCKVAGKPGWWFLLMFIPFVNIVIFIIVYLGLAEEFGQGAGFAVGLILLSVVFIPILGFSSIEYGGGSGYGRDSRIKDPYVTPGAASYQQASTPTQPPAGWYPDTQKGGQRWWDGKAWGIHETEQ